MPSLRSLLSFVAAMGAAAVVAVIFLVAMDMVIHVPLPYAVAGSFLLVAMIMTWLVYLASRHAASRSAFAGDGFESAADPGHATRTGTTTPRLRLLLGATGGADAGAAEPGTRRPRPKCAIRITLRSILLFDASGQQSQEEVA